ncbi:hypothetical protein [Nocardiopsis sp. CC223A]|uniref:hypothetical protein n=1 Tax=Nocardiopsis sp. CC223A TaxID=3044051 RepID=UPI00278C1687|nr:hypothetical protein [Nocardiopsis sp. CC223A]
MTSALAAPAPALTPNAEQSDCSMCNGQGGKWVTNDGSSKGKDLARWVACTGCGGTGKVGR